MAWEPNYTTTEGLAAFVRIGDALDDAVLSLAVSTASRAIDGRCRRQFGQVAAVEPRVYTPRYSRSRGGWLVPIDDVMTTTGLLVETDSLGDGSYATEVTSYRLRPHNAAAARRPWTELLLPSTWFTCTAPGVVQVTARWGWDQVPAAIEEACLLQASRLVARRDSPHGVAGSPEAGSEVRLLSRVDPDVAVAVEPYRRRVWAA